MENSIEKLIQNSKDAVKHWWLLFATGILLFIMSALIFVFPTQSYMSMAMLFGLGIFAMGLLQLVFTLVNRHFITGRGWMLAGSIIEIILGGILIFNVALSATLLPIFLGFWLLYRGFSAIGLGGDMSALQIPGAGWTVITGILLTLCALWILFQPLVFGTTAVVVWIGISLLFAGFASCSMAMQLREAHKHMK